MEQITLIKANFRKYKGVWIGILILSLMLSLGMASVLSFWQNSNTYINEEMERLGFGDLTVWVSGTTDISLLSEEISGNSAVENVSAQQLIFSDYRVGNSDSDTEGQLIVHDPNHYDYKFLDDNLHAYAQPPISIARDEVYISPALKSIFDINIGDSISFYIARQGNEKAFTVKGYFEDPFMGSSMIGMKGFLINNEDYKEMVTTIDRSGMDSLARKGGMLHIFAKPEENLSSTDLNRLLNEGTSLPGFMEFAHSYSSISGFMLLLQNIFAGLLLAFSIVMVIVCVIVLGHSMGSAMEQDYGNTGIYKALGMTGNSLRKSLFYFYGLAIATGLVVGVLLAARVTPMLAGMTVTTTGLLIPHALAGPICTFSLMIVFLLLMGFVLLKTKKIINVSPLSAIRKDLENTASSKTLILPIRQRPLCFWIALRQISSAKKRYASILIIAALLVFVMSLVGRMNSWLGPNGEGMMAAFNPADTHIGIQTLGDIGNEEIESLITSSTEITDSYLLAMPSLSINGADYTANVISQPQRFQILQGETSLAADEIVLTEFLAENLGVTIGDRLTVSSKGKSGRYKISGFYQCANDMGDNFGMSREGYLRIAKDDPGIWCVHYFISDTDKQGAIIQQLEDTFGGDVHLHENTWLGLDSIITSMKLLNTVLYGVVTLFIFIVVALTAGKMVMAEQRALGIYKSIGFSTKSLRLSFALRFGIVSLLGAILGIVSGSIFADLLVSLILKTVGISNFSSDVTFGATLFLMAFITILHLLFAYHMTGKIKKVEIAALLVE